MTVGRTAGRAPLQIFAASAQETSRRELTEAVRTRDEPRSRRRSAPRAPRMRPNPLVLGPLPAGAAPGRRRLRRRLAGARRAHWTARSPSSGSRRTTPTTARARRARGRAAARLAHPGIVALYESGARRRRRLPGLRARPRGDARRAAGGGRAVGPRRRSRSASRCATRSPTRTGAGSSTATSSRPNIIVPDRAGDGAGVAKLTDFGVARIAGEDVADPHRRRRRHARLHGARAGRGPRGRRRGRPLRARRSCSTRRSRGVNPVRGARRGGHRAPRWARASRRSGRLRRDLPLDLCEAIDRAVLAAPRGARRPARAAPALLAALRARATSAGRSRAPGPRARREVGRRRAPASAAATRRARRRGAGRGRARGRGAAWLGGRRRFARRPGRAPRRSPCSCSRAWAGWPPRAPSALWHGRDVAGCWPRSPSPRSLLLAAPGPLWSLPAAAPVLGLAGLGAAWPVLAGRAARRRGAAPPSAPWALVAGARRGRCSVDRLAPARPPARAGSGLDARRRSITSGGVAHRRDLGARRRSCCPGWCAAGVSAPDLVGATVWAAGLAPATQAVARTMAGSPRCGAVVAGAAASVALSDPPAHRVARVARWAP